MKKLIIKALPLLLISGFTMADYKVYSAPQNNDGKVIDIPEPNCESDLSGLANGMYIVCGFESSGEIPVLSSKAYLVEKVAPSYAFSCASGTYVNDYESLNLANFLGDNVYTPYYSFRATSNGISSVYPRGKAYYNIEGGTLDPNYSSYMFSSSIYVVDRGPRNRPQYGTRYELLGTKYGVTTTDYYYGIDYDSRIMTEIAYRACRVEPVL